MAASLESYEYENCYKSSRQKSCEANREQYNKNNSCEYRNKVMANTVYVFEYKIIRLQDIEIHILFKYIYKYRIKVIQPGPLLES